MISICIHTLYFALSKIVYHSKMYSFDIEKVLFKIERLGKN